MSAPFDMRLVVYSPLGARQGVLPDQGINITSTDTGPVLVATVSTKNLGQIAALGRDIEVAVETQRANGGWAEGRDSRFAVTVQNYDDRDPSGVRTLNGVGLAAWLMQAANLLGVAYYSRSDAATEAAHTATVSVSGTTFTWSGNPIGVGDRVQVVTPGNAKNLSTGGIYYCHDASGNNFSLTRNSNGIGDYINAGTASNVQLKRVVTRLLITGHQFNAHQAVKVSGVAGTGLSENTTYYVVNPSANSLQLSDKPGGVPFDLQVGSTAIGTIYTDVDGQRVFNNATPGAVMSAGFLEARGRGWGVNPSDSSQQMAHSWTVGADSVGAAWTTMASDPSTPAISCAFQPGTPLTQVLSFMLSNQYAEWYSTGRTIALVNYGTGNDHTVDKNPPVRIGRTASSAAVTVDLSAERNSYVIRGAGAVYVQVAGTPGPWGVLEDYTTATGIASASAATKNANTQIAANKNGQKGYVITENAQEADYLPTIDYSRGDWVAAQVDSDAWTRFRVAQWQFIKPANGAITVSTTLEYVKFSPIAKVARTQVASSSGISDSGTSNSPALASDNRKATAPTGISVSQVGTFAADDSATAVATVSWLPVTTDADGNPINTAQYEVWLRADGATAPYAVGATSALSMTLPALPSGHYYEVSVRAQSDTGQWGVLSAEVEFLTVTPVIVPNPPTAPSMTGKLGQVRVAWDGFVVDPTLGNEAPERGFAYVQALYSTSASGPWSPVGLNMGNAGFTSVSGLTVGSTYYFALQAVNVVGATSAMSAAVAFTVVGVKGPDIEANSVTANTIAAGAISADKLALGAVPSTATPVDRVPLALPNVAYWASVIAGTTVINSAMPSGQPGWTATAGGIQAPSTGGSTQTTLWVTNANPVPASGKVAITALGTFTGPSGSGDVVLRWLDSTGTPTTYVVISAPGTAVYAAPTGAASYDVYLEVKAPGTGGGLFSALHVFEVIGAGGGGQAAELSPQGLRLFDNGGNLAVDLTTSTSQYMRVLNSTAGDSVQVAGIDQSGNGSFLGEVDVAGAISTAGVLLTDPTDPEGLLNAAPNGSMWDPDLVPLLDRLGRGVIYDVTWASMNGYTVPAAAQYQRIAQDQFMLEDGRSYQFILQDGGLQATAPNKNVYLELQINTAPNANPTSGLAVMRAVIYGSTQSISSTTVSSNGYWALPPVVFAASAAQTTVDAVNRLLPAGVPLYWQLNTNISSAPSASWQMSEFGNTRGLTIIDVGSSRLTRPVNGQDTLAPTDDHTYSGSSSGSTSSGTSATSKTATFTAQSSRTWNNGGSGTVAGGGQFANPASMYYGTGNTDMGSWFGQFRDSSGRSLASVLSGKTVTAATVYVHCNYTYSSSGSTVNFGTGSMDTAPSSIGTPSSHTWTSTNVKAGVTLAKSLDSGTRTAMASGGVQSFVIGVGSGHAGVYSIFNGASQSSPPKITVTYH